MALKIEYQLGLIISLAGNVCVCRYMAMHAILVGHYCGDFYYIRFLGDRDYHLSIGCWAPDMVVE